VNYGKSILALGAIWLVLVIAFFAFSILCNLLLAWPFMWLWNASVVPAFSLTPITYWTSFWLLVFVAAFAAPKAVKVTKED